MFDLKGDVMDIYATTDTVMYRLHFDDEFLEHIEVKHSLTFASMGNVKKILLRPATQYLQDANDLQAIIARIRTEMESRCAEFLSQGKVVEEMRLRKKTTYDLSMIAET
jgi:excinuclease ABC subunit B